MKLARIVASSAIAATLITQSASAATNHPQYVNQVWHNNSGSTNRIPVLVLPYKVCISDTVPDYGHTLVVVNDATTNHRLGMAYMSVLNKLHTPSCKGPEHKSTTVVHKTNITYPYFESYVTLCPSPYRQPETDTQPLPTDLAGITSVYNNRLAANAGWIQAEVRQFNANGTIQVLPQFDRLSKC